MPDFGNLVVAPFFRSTLSSPVTANVSTEIIIADGSGIPDIASGKHMYATLVEGNVAETLIIDAWDSDTNTLSIADGVPPTNGFSLAGGRLELWFTAEAFEEMRDYVTGLVGDNYPGPDETTITVEGGGELRVARTSDGGGLESDHIKNGEINQNHLAGNSVRAAAINGGEIANVHISSTAAIATSKLADGAGFIVGRDGIREALARQAPNFETETAGLSFAHIAFSEVDFGAAPSGGEEGNIAIEWESIS